LFFFYIRIYLFKKTIYFLIIIIITMLRPPQRGFAIPSFFFSRAVPRLRSLLQCEKSWAALFANQPLCAKG